MTVVAERSTTSGGRTLVDRATHALPQLRRRVQVGVPVHREDPHGRPRDSLPRSGSRPPRVRRRIVHGRRRPDSPCTKRPNAGRRIRFVDARRRRRQTARSAPLCWRPDVDLRPGDRATPRRASSSPRSPASSTSRTRASSRNASTPRRRDESVLVLDLNRVVFIDSAALHVLFKLAERRPNGRARASDGAERSGVAHARHRPDEGRRPHRGVARRARAARLRLTDPGPFSQQDELRTA